MDIGLLFQGLIIGFSIAAPVGPIGVLCIRRTLTAGRALGLVSGLGAATADAIYGCVAGFGLTLVSSFLIHQQIWFRLVGGLFLCYLGFKNLFSKPSKEAVKARGNSLIGSYASTFLLTLTNPITIISFAAIFAGLGLAGENGDYASAGILVLGVFIGSAMWWFLLVIAVGLFRQRFTSRHLGWINKISGAIIMLFGLIALASMKG